MACKYCYGSTTPTPCPRCGAIPKQEIQQPVPISHNGVTGKDAICSHCKTKVSWVSCPETNHIIGLVCSSCRTFWALILPKKD